MFETQGIGQTPSLLERYLICLTTVSGQNGYTLQYNTTVRIFMLAPSKANVKRTIFIG